MLVAALDSVSTLERIQLTGQLAQGVNDLSAAMAPMDRIRSSRQVLALLARLGIDLAASQETLSFSLDDPEKSAQALRDYLDGPINQLPQNVRIFEAASVIDLAATLGDRDLVTKAQALRTPGEQSVLDLYMSVTADVSSRAVSVPVDRAAVLGHATAVENLLRQRVEDDAEYAEHQVRINELTNEVTAAQREIQAWSDANPGQHVVAQARYDKVYADYVAAHEEVYAKAMAAWRRFKAVRNEAIEQADQAFDTQGQIVIDALMASSTVSVEEASSWASRQVIDDKAQQRLTRMGYKKADVLRDLAEFYRLTGGKSSAIRIAAGGARANATGIETRTGEKVINLGNNFNKTVLFHELAHHLENDPIACAAANGFLIKRRESADVHPLAELSGNNYGPEEVAYKDSFMDAYIGKVYRDGWTEVFSMGVQYLANPRDAAMFAAKDPEMLALISGYLASPVTPAMRAKLDMHKGATDAIQAKRQEMEEAYATAVAELAARAPLQADDWWQVFQEEHPDIAGLIRTYEFAKGSEPTYVGGYEGYRVLQGVCRNQLTKRNAKGLVIASRLNLPLPECASVHAGLDLARALITYADTNGIGVSSAWYTFFYQGKGFDARKSIIRSAQSIQEGKQ
ncbi:hypothetical protein [Pseudomonas sp.]|uniref:hypothetical protein n=1 Tax=Pseudomonas sp. TaxID=306 RepID=UPI002EDB24CF